MLFEYIQLWPNLAKHDSWSDSGDDWTHDSDRTEWTHKHGWAGNHQWAHWTDKAANNASASNDKALVLVLLRLLVLDLDLLVLIVLVVLGDFDNGDLLLIDWGVALDDRNDWTTNDGDGWSDDGGDWSNDWSNDRAEWTHGKSWTSEDQWAHWIDDKAASDTTDNTANGILGNDKALVLLLLLVLMLGLLLLLDVLLELGLLGLLRFNGLRLLLDRLDVGDHLSGVVGELSTIGGELSAIGGELVHVLVHIL